jgi:hypothetical protein
VAVRFFYTQAEVLTEFQKNALSRIYASLNLYGLPAYPVMVREFKTYANWKRKLEAKLAVKARAR